MSDVNFNETPPPKSNLLLGIILGVCGCFGMLLIAVGILVAMLLPVIQALLPDIQTSRGTAIRMQCTNHMKQIGLAMHTYHDKYKCLPPVYTMDKDGNPLHSWRVLLLPFIEQTALYRQIHLDEPWDSEYNKQFHSQMVSAYSCPSNSGSMVGGTDYSVVVGEETPFHATGNSPKLSYIQDGTSNTICLVERKTPICWMEPTQEITFEQACQGINVSENGIGSNHSGGVNVGIFDGSIRFISDTIDLDALRAAFTRAGGESIPLD